MDVTEAPGFPAEIPSPTELEELHRVMRRCTRCDLFLSRTQVVPGAGPVGADLFFVGEAPGAMEDAKGLPFVGRSGALLDEMLLIAGLSRDEIFIGNLVRCRPARNRNPRAAELRACAGWLTEQIRLVRPRLMVTLGVLAAQRFLPGARITQVQGELHSSANLPDSLLLYPLLHPAAIIRNPRLRPDYEVQFRRLREFLDRLPPRKV